jgi:hypothetical protein
LEDGRARAQDQCLRVRLGSWRCENPHTALKGVRGRPVGTSSLVPQAPLNGCHPPTSRKSYGVPNRCWCVLTACCARTIRPAPGRSRPLPRVAPCLRPTTPARLSALGSRQSFDLSSTESGGGANFFADEMTHVVLETDCARMTRPSPRHLHMRAALVVGSMCPLD